MLYQLFSGQSTFTKHKSFMEQEIIQPKSVSRKKFLLWGLSISSLLAVPAFLRPSKKKVSDGQTVKMLGQDGKLVEIDISHIPDKKSKLKDKDIHTWVRNKTSSL
jgi:hypothetical protein